MLTSPLSVFVEISGNVFLASQPAFLLSGYESLSLQTIRYLKSLQKKMKVKLKTETTVKISKTNHSVYKPRLKSKRRKDSSNKPLPYKLKAFLRRLQKYKL